MKSLIIAALLVASFTLTAEEKKAPVVTPVTKEVVAPAPKAEVKAIKKHKKHKKEVCPKEVAPVATPAPTPKVEVKVTKKEVVATAPKAEVKK